VPDSRHVGVISESLQKYYKSDPDCEFADSFIHLSRGGVIL
jgi:hypothetical protein